MAELDLAGLDSVRAFAEWLRSEHQGIDLLVNNAGVMAPPRRRTADGFALSSAPTFSVTSRSPAW